ncbi:hypothetical protein [Anaeromyxobacter paludicola]|uniref:Rad50/SbcC-type AAA domain-containing protein n=1 Tax=Anaeromyxobacter paludicola TaxID=2918171 RepID=A0ABM7XFW4_9BACT|nr:hypothetical protein [Anaeromyxobacter paludicola]BDG10793.1 hypothetical protein AMPC_39060 [Anaeromyxobacter paludicola]
MSLHLRHLRLRATTPDGVFGTDISFTPGLFILRADNTSGKSTCLQAIIYALGLEGMWGPKHDVPLPHAMTAKVSDGHSEHPVIESEVLLEIENGRGEVLTVKRPVKSITSLNLISTWNAPLLTVPGSSGAQTDYFVREKGAAVRGVGFHHMLARFIGWTLPSVARYAGGESPLYLECIFPMLFVEQRRGWTLAIRYPTHLGIREVGRHVVDFLLKLDVERIDAEKRRLRELERDLVTRWQKAAGEVGTAAGMIGAVVESLPTQPTTSWPPAALPTLVVHRNDTWVRVDDVIQADEELLQRLAAGPVPTVREDAPALAAKLKDLEDALAQLDAVASGAVEDVETETAELQSVRSRISSIDKELQRNRDALKLSKLGSVQALALSGHSCPTCQQAVSDDLLPQVLKHESMPLAENIAFLDEQRKLASLVAADSEAILRGKQRELTIIRERADALRSEIRAVRTTLTSNEQSPSVAAIEQRLRIEERVARYRRAIDEVSILIAGFEELVAEYKHLLSARAELPKEALSHRDQAKLGLWEQRFVEYCERFGLKSVEPRSLNISRETYRPVHEGFDLDFVRSEKPKEMELEFDFSASDTIRAVWAYLLGMMSVDHTFTTNYPRLLVFDEPRQQSTASESLGEFLKIAAQQAQGGRQVLVATSETLPDLEPMLKGVPHSLLSFEGRILKRVPS